MPEWIWHRNENVPALVKVNEKDFVGGSVPLSKPAALLVQVCGFCPQLVTVTLVPTVTCRPRGEKELSLWSSWLGVAGQEALADSAGLDPGAGWAAGDAELPPQAVSATSEQAASATRVITP